VSESFVEEELKHEGGQDVSETGHRSSGDALALPMLNPYTVNRPISGEFPTNFAQGISTSGGLPPLIGGRSTSALGAQADQATVRAPVANGVPTKQKTSPSTGLGLVKGAANWGQEAIGTAKDHLVDPLMALTNTGYLLDGVGEVAGGSIQDFTDAVQQGFAPVTEAVQRADAGVSKALKPFTQIPGVPLKTKDILKSVSGIVNVAQYHLNEGKDTEGVNTFEKNALRDQMLLMRAAGREHSGAKKLLDMVGDDSQDKEDREDNGDHAYMRGEAEKLRRGAAVRRFRAAGRAVIANNALVKANKKQKIAPLPALTFEETAALNDKKYVPPKPLGLLDGTKDKPSFVPKKGMLVGKDSWDMTAAPDPANLKEFLHGDAALAADPKRQDIDRVNTLVNPGAKSVANPENKISGPDEANAADTNPNAVRMMPLEKEEIAARGGDGYRPGTEETEDFLRLKKKVARARKLGGFGQVLQGNVDHDRLIQQKRYRDAYVARVGELGAKAGTGFAVGATWGLTAGMGPVAVPLMAIGQVPKEAAVHGVQEVGRGIQSLARARERQVDPTGEVKKEDLKDTWNAFYGHSAPDKKQEEKSPALLGQDGGDQALPGQDGGDQALLGQDGGEQALPGQDGGDQALLGQGSDDESVQEQDEGGQQGQKISARMDQVLDRGVAFGAQRNESELGARGRTWGRALWDNTGGLAWKLTKAVGSGFASIVKAPGKLITGIPKLLAAAGKGIWKGMKWAGGGIKKGWNKLFGRAAANQPPETADEKAQREALEAQQAQQRRDKRLENKAPFEGPAAGPAAARGQEQGAIRRALLNGKISPSDVNQRREDAGDDNIQQAYALLQAKAAARRNSPPVPGSEPQGRVIDRDRSNVSDESDEEEQKEGNLPRNVIEEEQEDEEKGPIADKQQPLAAGGSGLSEAMRKRIAENAALSKASRERSQQVATAPIQQEKGAQVESRGEQVPPGGLPLLADDDMSFDDGGPEEETKVDQSVMSKGVPRNDVPDASSSGVRGTRPVTDVEVKEPLQGGRAAVGRANTFKGIREAGLVMQGQMGPSDFYREGRYLAATGSTAAQLGLHAGRVASGIGVGMAGAATGGGAIVAGGFGLLGQSAFSGAMGGIGEALVRQERGFAATQVGRLAAAQRSRDLWNEHYHGLDEKLEGTRQPRRVSAAQKGVRFRDRNNPLITGVNSGVQTFANYTQGTVPGSAVQKGTPILKGIRNKSRRFAAFVGRSFPKNPNPGSKSQVANGNRSIAALQRLRDAQSQDPLDLLQKPALEQGVENEKTELLSEGSVEEKIEDLVPGMDDALVPSSKQQEKRSKDDDDWEDVKPSLARDAMDPDLAVRKGAWTHEFAPERSHWLAPKAKHGARDNIRFWHKQIRNKLSRDYADLPTGKEHQKLSADERAEILAREQLALAPKIDKVERDYNELRSARGKDPLEHRPYPSAQSEGLDQRIAEHGEALRFVDAINERRKAADVFHSLGGGGNPAAASALGREDRAARRALEPLISRTDAGATPDNAKKGSTWKAMAEELHGDEPNWPKAQDASLIHSGGTNERRSDGIDEPQRDAGTNADDGRKATSGLQTASSLFAPLERVATAGKVAGYVSPAVKEVGRITSPVPLFHAIGAAGKLVSGLGGTASAYLNRDADPTLTGTEEQRSVQSAQEAFGQRRGQFAEDQKLMAEGSEIPRLGTKGHGVRMFQAMVARVKANRALELAQTKAGITTENEYSMEQSQSLMNSPALLDDDN